MNGEFVRLFESLHTWQSHGYRAPHKPLLVLWAIGRCLRHHARLTPFKIVDGHLKVLLNRFGPHRKTIHTEDPFWRLQNDGVWEIDRPELVRIGKNGGAYRGDLLRFAICGGFTQQLFTALQSDLSLAIGIAESLVVSHFPSSLHDEVLEATLVGSQRPSDADEEIEDDWTYARRKRRDPYFRDRVFAAYGAHCAVCRYAGQLHDRPLALDAAHIRWHEANGPPIVENGLVLCSLHHRLFDGGAFTIDSNFKVKISSSIVGSGVESALGDYHGKKLIGYSPAQSPKPDEKYLAWHRREVFQGRDPM